MKRLLTAATAVSIILILLLSSCSQAETSDVNSTEKTTEVVYTEPTSEDIVFVAINSLPKTDFDGRDLTFIVRGESYHSVWNSKEIYAEVETGETINDAVYRRNIFVEDRFNLKISETRAGASMLSDIRKAIQSGDAVYDVLMPDMERAVSLTRDNYLIDMDTLESPNFSNSWWDQGIDKYMSIGGKRFFAVGEISILDKQGTRGTYFNKDMINSFGLDSPYDLVYDNKWTANKMLEMMKAAGGRDVDGDGIMNDLDGYGLLSESGGIRYFINILGGKYVTFDRDGTPSLSLTSERSLAAFDKACELLYDTSLTVYYDMVAKTRAYTDYSISTVIFGESRALFAEFGMNVLQTWRALDVDFGIVPSPKLNLDDNFAAPVYHNAVSALCIPVTNNEAEMTGVALEALCAYSLITLTDAYYNVSLQTKFSRDEETGAMLDIIFANKVYDMGLTYNFGGLIAVIQNLASTRSTNLVGEYTKIEEKAKAELSAIISEWSNIN